METSDKTILASKTYIQDNQSKKSSNRLNNKSEFYFLAIVVGIFSALGMALLTVALTQLGTFSTPVIMFVKYLILGAGLLWLLTNQRKKLGNDYKFMKGIRLGALTTFASAITIALANTFLYTFEANLETNNPTDPSSFLGGAFINGGVVFMECLVFGMILTFICLQALKRGRPGEENF